MYVRYPCIPVPAVPALQLTRLSRETYAPSARLKTAKQHTRLVKTGAGMGVKLNWRQNQLEAKQTGGTPNWRHTKLKAHQT